MIVIQQLTENSAPENKIQNNIYDTINPCPAEYLEVFLMNIF